MKKKTKRICLALQGGGSYGAFTWGILEEILEDERLEIEAISATSSGSMNAVVLASGLLHGGKAGAKESLTELWRAVSNLGFYFNPVRNSPWSTATGVNYMEQLSFLFFDTFNRIYSPYLINPYNYNPLREYLIDHVDFETLHKRSKVKIFVTATNVRTGQIKIFDSKHVTADAVMASACLPNLYQAVEIDGEFYWDGGYLGNPAIFPLIYNSNIDDILIIHTNPFFRHHVPTTATEIYNRINEISFNSSLIRELRAIRFINKLMDKKIIRERDMKMVRRKYIHAIRSDEIMHQFNMVDKHRWEWDFLTHLRDLGREAAKRWIAKNYKKIGEKSTVDFSEFSQ